MVMDVIAGYDPQDKATSWEVLQQQGNYAASLDQDFLKGKRIGVLGSFFGTAPEHDQVNLVTLKAIERMRAAGASIIDISEKVDSNELLQQASVHLYDLQEDLDCYLARVEAASPVHSLADIIASGHYHPGIGENIKAARMLSKDSLEYKDHLLYQVRLRDQMVNLLVGNSLDAMVYPHQKRLVVPVGQTQVERNGVLASVTGFPAITVPAGFSLPTDSAPAGIPIGIEFLGRPWGERSLLSIAYSLEMLQPWQQLPPSTPQL
jgi:Asp-tRNA(Asn)/Glu-tRNA(Gln) amidotransferase A subunit family amidase